MTIRFLLVCEGSSDAALVPHIRRLLIDNGQADPQGSHWAGSKPLVDKIREGVQHYGDCDLLFIHRDADSDQETPSAGPLRRSEEIDTAVRGSGYIGPWVGIVPVRMTETWLILDESAIRRAAGRPQSSLPLDLPTLGHVENESDPKGCLERALVTASGTSGRRLRKFRRDLPYMRYRLLEGLPVGGPLNHVSSWRRFRDDLLMALTITGDH